MAKAKIATLEFGTRVDISHRPVYEQRKIASEPQEFWASDRRIEDRECVSGIHEVINLLNNSLALFILIIDDSIALSRINSI